MSEGGQKVQTHTVKQTGLEDVMAGRTKEASSGMADFLSKGGLYLKACRA